MHSFVPPLQSTERNESKVSDCEMTDEDTEMKDTGDVHGMAWTRGEEEKSGCDVLTNIIKEFTSCMWDATESASPFPNIVMLGLSFLANLVSEEILNFILDMMKWWQREEVLLHKMELPENAKQLKYRKKKWVPNVAQFVGVFTKM